MKNIRVGQRAEKEKCRKTIRKNHAGFTLAELLATVGILAILLCVGMVALVQYQRSLKLTEMDAAAKQIFIAAQNQMMSERASGEWAALAKEQTETASDEAVNENGYFGTAMTAAPGDYPDDDFEEEGHEFYYIKVNSESTLSDTIMKEILPYGSIDEEVRNSGGCYIIEYDYATASVYGVFYTDNEAGIDYTKCNELRTKSGRKKYKPTTGYYGGALAKSLTTEDATEEVDVAVDNGDKLTVEIADPYYFQKASDGEQYATQVKVVLTGEESGNTQTYLLKVTKSGANYALKQELASWVKAEKKSVDIYDEETKETVATDSMVYTLTLDDITSSGKNFANMFCDSKSAANNGGKGDALIPGENLTVKAVVGSTNVLFASKKKSVYTNSLFEEKYVDSASSTAQAVVSSVRHLQNLNMEISGLALTSGLRSANGAVVTKVIQTKDIDWTSDANGVDWEKATIYKNNKEKASENSFYGIENTSLSEYDGGNNTLSGFVIQTSGNMDAGLFRTIGGASNSAQQLNVKNLLLMGFEVDSENGNAGVLLGGTKEQATLVAESVVAAENSAVTVTGSGDAGGLAGHLGAGTGVASVIQDCAASVKVTSKGGDAGGLVGSFSGGATSESEQMASVLNSYSGGYTEEKQYTATANVQAGKNAGGLIGQVSGSVNIENCYSTSSVSGNTTAGGFVGDGGAGAVYKNDYSTGLVVKRDNGSAALGTFAGTLTGGAVTDCYYLTGINVGNIQVIGGSTSAIIDGKSSSAMAAMASGKTVDTHANDTQLKEEEYPFPTVNTAGKSKDAVADGVHYGDWQERTEQYVGTAAYYEIYNENGIYSLGLYNRASSINVNTLRDDLAIVQDGYVMLSEKEGSVYVNGRVCKNVSQLTGGIADVILQGDGAGNILTDDIQVKINDKSYYLRFMDLQTVNDISSSLASYKEMKVGMSAGSENVISIWMNPHYAKSEIYDSGLQLPVSSNFSIRTERQYSMMTQDLQITSAGIVGTVFGQYYKQAFTQERDLTFGEGTAYTTSYFSAQTADTTGTGTVATLGPIVASNNTINTKSPQDTVGFQGTYDGNGYSISNLSLTQSAGKAAGMFGNTQGALIKNVVLNNLTVDAPSCNYVGSVVGSAAHTGIVGWGSTKGFTEIDSVTVYGANIIGNRYVGGLAGIAHSCSVNADMSQVYLNNISITGDSVIGGVFGLCQNYGNQIKDGISIQNITLQDSSITQSVKAENKTLASSGVGGAIGILQRQGSENTRRITMTGITVSNTPITITENKFTGNYIFVGGFIGNMAYPTGNLSISNTRADATITLNGTSSDSAHYAVGAVYGYMSGTQTLSQTTSVGVYSVTANASALSGRYTIGGAVGYSVASLTWAPGAYAGISGNYAGITPSNTESFGAYIGRMDGSGTFAIQGGAAVNVAAPSWSYAIYNGGLIGKVAGTAKISSLNVSKVSGQVNFTGDYTSYAGGLIGQLTGNASMTGVHIEEEDITVAGYASNGFGGCVGYSGGSITNCYVNNPKITGAAGNMGGFAGVCSSAVITSSDVHSTILAGASGSADTALAVTNSLADGNAGGFAGKISASSMEKCFAAIPVKGTGTGMSVGGFAGYIAGGSISYSYASCDVENADYSDNSATGGFTGSVSDCSEFLYSYATGDVSKGATVGGFAGALRDDSAYMNKCYSLGLVDQDSPLHGGFVGSQIDQLTANTSGVNTDMIQRFYSVLEMNLADPEIEDLTEDDKAVISEALEKLKKRSSSVASMNPASIYNYLKSQSSLNVDALADNDKGWNANPPSTAAIIGHIMEKVSVFTDVKDVMRSWRIVKSSSSMEIWYTPVSLSGYTKEEVANETISIVGYRYKKAADGSISRQKGRISLANGDSSIYGDYIILDTFTGSGSWEDVSKPEVYFTGCTYLRDTTYNDCDTWADDPTGEGNEKISSKTFAEFTDADGDFLKTLNQTSAQGENGTDFQMASNETHHYEDELEDPYPYPALTAVIGAASAETKGATHWGDWPVEPVYPVKYGVAYYEDYSDTQIKGTDGNAYGIYAVTTELEGEEKGVLNTLADKVTGETLEDSKTKYGLLLPSGSAKANSAIKVDAAIQLELEGNAYDFYPFNDSKASNSGHTASVALSGNSLKFQSGNQTYTPSTCYINPDFAAAITETAADMGTAAPYQIRTEQQLRNISLSTGNYVTGSKYFIQTYDVYLGATSFTRIGGENTNQFNGTYDGQGYTIYNLYQNVAVSSNRGSAGMFGWTTGTLKNIVLEGANVTVSSAKTSYRIYAGILAAELKGSMENCIVKNSNLKASGKVEDAYIGGIVGELNNSASVKDCRISEDRSVATTETVNVSLELDDSNSYCYAGGAIGHSNGTASIEALYTQNVKTVYYVSDDSTKERRAVGGMIGSINAGTTTVKNSGVTGGTVTNNSSKNNNTGGFIGCITTQHTSGTNPQLEDCYVTGTKVTGCSSAEVGGFVSYVDCGTISRCYSQAEVQVTNGLGDSAVGGFVGIQNDSGASSLIKECYAKNAIVCTENITQANMKLGGFIGHQASTTTQGRLVVESCYALEDCSQVDDGRTKAAGVFVGKEDSKVVGAIRNCFAIQDVDGEIVPATMKFYGERVTNALQFTGGVILGDSDSMNTPINGLHSLTAEAFKTLDTFVSKFSWSDTIWEMKDGAAYPTLINTPEPETEAPAAFAFYNGVGVTGTVNLSALMQDTVGSQGAQEQNAVQKAETDKSAAGSTIVSTEGAEALPMAGHAGLAYYENDSAGYEGWYAITAGAEGDNEAAPYNTLRTDKDVVLADDAVSYGVLVEAGTMTYVSGVAVEPDVTATVEIDGIYYEYHKIYKGTESSEESEAHGEKQVQIEAAGDTLTFAYNDDFGAAVSYQKPLGVAAESGGTPYQIRTQQQLRNIGSGQGAYLNAAYGQTLDIWLSDDDFAPIGTSQSAGIAEEPSAFTGSYDAGDGYHIRNLHQSGVIRGGLFGVVSGTVQGVNLSGRIWLNRTKDTEKLNGYVGSIAAVNTGNILKCNSEVVIYMDTECMQMSVGGLVGYSTGLIQESTYNGLINGKVSLQQEEGYTVYAGGLVGENCGIDSAPVEEVHGVIEKSGASAIINLNVENSFGDTYMGGLAGRTSGKNTWISESWSQVTYVDAGGVLGGFVGIETGTKEAHTVFTDDTAVMTVTNPDIAQAMGLFAGQSGQMDIWRCHASELTLAAGTDIWKMINGLNQQEEGDYKVTGTLIESGYSFIAGQEFDLAAHACDCPVDNSGGAETIPANSEGQDGQGYEAPSQTVPETESPSESGNQGNGESESGEDGITPSETEE